jgi:HEPN domain-containing protein
MLQARFDLEAAAWNLKGGFHNTVCFLAQQASEKALKSLLYHAGASRTKLMTHSTAQLLTAASASIPVLEALLDDARELDLHYIPSRYPNGLPGGYPHSFYGEKTARTTLECARRILGAVQEYYALVGFDFEATD